MDTLNIEPYSSRAGIGWRCRSCASTWSGARADHTEPVCTAVQLRRDTCCVRKDWGLVEQS